jgi:hypothetical protein
MPRVAEELIRLTPSAVRQVVAERPRWGWRPGLPVLILRKDDSFAFTVGKLGVEYYIEFASRGIHLAIFASEADYFRGSVLSANFEALFEKKVWWLENPNDLGQSGCSDPLGASCSPEKFRQLHPELFGLRGLAAWAASRLAREDRDQLIARTSAFLRWGDARAAVVLRTNPLVVASYCDEMDATFLLQFPSFLGSKYALTEGTRLVTTNLHRAGGGRVVPDIVPGPAYLGRYTNVRPLIADFLAAEGPLVEARRWAIAEREYRRCEELGEQAFREGRPLRSGRPLEAGTPGKVWRT